MPNNLKKDQETKLAITLLLIIFPPIGFYLMFRKRIWRPKTRILIMIFVSCFYLFIIWIAFLIANINIDFPSTNTKVTTTTSTSFTDSEKDNTYRVVSVVDGDTIKVQSNGQKTGKGEVATIRFIGFDTPETKDPRKPVQCFGKEATNKMKALVSNKTVILKEDPSQGDKDKYNRLLRYAFLQDGTNVGLEMIQGGFAHEYTYNLPYKYQSDFEEAENNARRNNIGLWSANTCNGDTTQPA